MKDQYKMLRRADIVTLCVFRSTPQNIAKYADGVRDGSLITLSDEKGSVYHSFMVGKSTRGFLHDAAKMVRNLPKYKKHVHVGGMIKDVKKVRQLPADFFIDENGVVVDVVRGGLLTFERMEAFIPQDRRCKCYKKDCISPLCREKYEQILRENVIYAG